jgi:hypothetical protein
VLRTKPKVFGGGSIEGEISSDPPDAAAQTESEPEGGEEAPEQSNSADKPAVLAKDGKHLIPFEELENAREQARQWKQRAEEASALAEHLKNTGQQQTPDESASGKEGEGSIDLDNLEMQAEEASLAGDMDTYRVLRKQINSEVERRAASRAIEALQEREARERQRAIETAVQAEHRKPSRNTRSSITWGRTQIGRRSPKCRHCATFMPPTARRLTRRWPTRLPRWH